MPRASGTSSGRAWSSSPVRSSRRSSRWSSSARPARSVGSNGFERQAASQLNESAGANFTADSVDCGNTSVVLGADNVLRCALIMPASGQVYDLDLAVTDLDGRHFALKVADAPRA